jgi:hypothetical protein
MGSMTIEEAVALLKASGDYDLRTDYGDAIRTLVDAAENVQWEYGTRWLVPGDPDAYFEEYQVDHIVEYAEDSREEAEQIIAEHRKATGRDEGTLIRRPTFDSPWKEVK